MSKKVYHLNTRILQFPAPKSPITIASIEGYTFEEEKLYSPAFLQAGTQQLEDLRHKFATRPAIDSLESDVVSATHLELIVKEMKEGKIKQDSVTLLAHPKEGVVIQIHLK